MNMKGKSREPVWISKDLLEEIDAVAGKLGFRSREEFVEAAVRRLIDRYVVLGVKRKN